MKTLVCAMSLLLGSATAAWSQVPTATLRGFVQDSSGGVLPGAVLNLKALGTGQQRQGVTDADGRYEFSFLPIGRYELSAGLSGFKTIVRPLTLAVDQTLRLDLTMELGATEETINVVGEVPLVQTTSANPGTVIDGRRMVDIPLNSRDFQQLTLLAPGSVVPPGGDVTFTINVAGQRTDANDFLIDGSTNNDLRNNQIVMPPNVETVQEFKIQENSFNAEYGRASGAVVNIVTRSGTNQFEGTAFEFLRNELFDSRNYFDNQDAPVPPFKRNVFGGVIGGPILRGRTFFFASYEGRRQRESVTLRSRVPTDEERRGIIRNAQGAIIQDFSGRIDPVAQELLTLVPLPNTSGSFNWVGIGKRPRDADQYSIKLDHDFNNANRTTFSYLWQRDSRIEPATSTNIEGFGDVRDAHRYHATVSHQASLSQRVLNQTVIGFNMLDAVAYGVDQSVPTDFGINNGVTDPVGLPNVNVVGWFQLGHGTAPFGWKDPKYTVRNAFSIVAGSHSMRLGGEWRTWSNRQYGLNTGQYRFDGTFTTNAYADFLSGRAATVNAVFGDQTTKLRTDVYSLFVQDDWTLSSRLTLNAGVRWEYYTPPTELQDRSFQTFDTQTGTVVRSDSPYRAQKDNIAPRFGIAFDPRGNGKMAIRGGYGIFYNQGTVGVARNLVLNPPEATSITFRGTTLANPFTGQGVAPVPTLDTVEGLISTPLVHSYNANVQFEVLPSTMLEIGYYGSTGRDLEVTRDINQAVFVPGGSTATNTDARRPYPGYGSILKREFIARSSYDAMHVVVQRRMSSGFTASGSYVLSNSEDLGSSAGFRPQDSRNLEADWGPSDFDVRHRAVVNFIWEIPGRFESGVLNALLADWQISGVSQFQTGSPLNVILATDNSLTGVRQDRPNLVGEIELDDPSATGWLDPAAFGTPAQGQFGTLPRNAARGPGFSTTDLAMSKRFVAGATRLEFRFEVYNLTNTVNLAAPSVQLGSANFGQISRTRTIRGDAGSSRQLQLGVKVHF